MRTIFLALVVALVGGCGTRDQLSVDVGHDSAPIEEKPVPVEPIACEPGGRYVCDCENGNRGNKFCAWTGDAFGACELCGDGAEVVDITSIPCDEDTPCPPPAAADWCAPLSCWGGFCAVTTAIPSASPPDATPNDCAAVMCDGNGNGVAVPDPLDCTGTCDDAGACVPTP